MKELVFSRLSDTAILPTRANAGDAGLDLYAIEKDLVLSDVRRVRTGIAVAIPEGYYGRIAPRSGLARKNGVSVYGGVLDSSYRGEILVLLTAKNLLVINPGDRIAQLIIEKIATPTPVWGELDATARGEGGFGSSGV